MKTIKQINFDAAFTVRGWRGIAFRLIGYAKINEPIMCYLLDGDGNEVEQESGEYDQVEDRDNVIAVMIGDDRKHIVAVEDLTEINEEQFCHSCGQIGCQHDGR